SRRRETSALDVDLELPVERREAQLSEGLGLDLTNAFAGQFEALAHVFERLVAGGVDAEAHAENLLFARSQELQEFARFARELFVAHRVVRRREREVFDE